MAKKKNSKSYETVTSSLYLFVAYVVLINSIMPLCYDLCITIYFYAHGFQFGIVLSSCALASEALSAFGYKNI